MSVCGQVKFHAKGMMSSQNKNKSKEQSALIRQAEVSNGIQCAKSSKGKAVFLAGSTLTTLWQHHGKKSRAQ